MNMISSFRCWIWFRIVRHHRTGGENVDEEAVEIIFPLKEIRLLLLYITLMEEVKMGQENKRETDGKRRTYAIINWYIVLGSAVDSTECT